MVLPGVGGGRRRRHAAVHHRGVVPGKVGVDDVPDMDKDLSVEQGSMSRQLGRSGCVRGGEGLHAREKE